MHITEKRTQTILDYLCDNYYTEYCLHYGEPGYSDPVKGIILCDWNNVSKQVQEYLEEAGYSLEWCDEWTIDYDYNKAYRTSPDSYHWVSQVAYTEDGELLTPDDSVSEWISHLEMTDRNHPAKALPDWITEEDVIAEGFEKIGEDYETGFHPGQTDDPKALAKKLFDEKNAIAVIFRIEESSQFYTVWQAYAKFDE